MAQYDIVKGVKSSGKELTEHDSMFVSQGGVATSTTVTGGRLNIFSGGKTRSSWIYSKGTVTVYSGGLASFTTLDSTYTSMYLSGGTAIQNVTYSNGWLEVLSGGVASLNYVVGGTMTVFSGGKAVDTDLDRNGIAIILSGGIMKNTNISAFGGSGGKLSVFDGGLATKTTVFSGGSMVLSSGGEATSTSITYGGSMIVYSGGNATTTTISGGSMIVSSGGNASTVTLKNGYMSILSSGSTTNLKLSGGSLFIGNGAIVDSLTNKGGTLVIEKGAIVDNYKGLPLALPDCDNGWNNYLYNKKLESPLNLEVTNKAPIVITSKTGNVQMDNNSVSNEGLHNFVGYGDEKDFIKIQLNCATTLSFLLSATGPAKFTIWSLVSDTKMKSLQATTLKKDAKTGLYQTETKGLLLTADTYYISMESTNASKGGNAFYNVALSDKSIFYVKGKNFDDGWYDFCEDDYSGSGFLGTVNGKKEVLIDNEWVGYGDEIDFRKFKLDTAAKLSFAITSTDLVSFSLCRVDSKTNKNEIVTFSLKTLQSTTVKKTEENSYYALTKLILLDPGYYYLRVESKNAKKGGSADYVVSLNTEESVFFNRGNHDDDWSDKGKGWKANKKYEYTINKNTHSLILNEWVGYNDEIDFRKFTLTTDANLSFELYASDAVKFTIYTLSRKETKDMVSYTLKTLQTTTLKADELKETNSIYLTAGEYYFSMQSTNAKKGGNASYDVSVAEFSTLPQEEELSLALRGPGETDTMDFTNVISSVDEIANSGLAAFSGADWVDLLMPPSTADSSSSPIQEKTSNDCFAALTDNGAAVSGIISPDAPSENDAMLSRNTALLA